MDGKEEEPSPKRTRTSSDGRGRPNFFVAIQVTNPEIHKAVRVVQDLVTSKKPLYKSVLIKLITLHITLCTLCLPGNDDIRRAKNALRNIEKDVKETLKNNPVTLKFKGIGSFKNEVVFAKVEPGEPLTQVKNIHSGLLKALIDEGLLVTDDFTPHLTIMKMSRDKSLRKKRIFKIPKDLYEDKCDLEFGDQTVRSIQLLRIGDHKENTYYNCYHRIDSGIDDDVEDDHIDCCGVKSVTPSCVIEVPPEETPKETNTSRSVKIIDMDVGGKELYYKAVTSSEASLPKGNDVESTSDLSVAEIKMTELLKPEKGVSSNPSVDAMGEGKKGSSAEEMNEAGQGDADTPRTDPEKTVDSGLQHQDDSGGKPGN
ncbi:A-kinase anchor protein 7-like [Ischnura elegans]|uniref:A-kinase anchor protein 7-like n=1 Tax=Ischnura elegans TaxID=197161 RepID=UPI001ED86836|nr:A-kinase anchor protein 7-like [Ischnura elegans]